MRSPRTEEASDLRQVSQGGPAPCRSSQEVLGTPLAITDYEGTLDWIDHCVDSGAREYLCVAPVHLVMLAWEDPEVMIAVGGAGMVVPDGQPLVWSLKALGADGASRVYGPDLMAAAFERGARTGKSMYLYGGKNQGALVQLTLNLRRRYPGIEIVGGYSPPYRPLEVHEEEAVASDINASGADIVWVGTGQPKQEIWMAGMRDKLDAPVLIGVGAAFDFHAGLVQQAPKSLQDAGMEWAWRLAKEPSRLWHRYLRYNPLFVKEFARQWARQRRSNTPADASAGR